MHLRKAEEQEEVLLPEAEDMHPPPLLHPPEVQEANLLKAAAAEPEATETPGPEIRTEDPVLMQLENLISDLI